MNQFLSEQKKFIYNTFNKLSSLEESTTKNKKDGKWSAREIIGHLIDSASNNHQRFIRAQFSEDLVFPGYDQDEWVRVQKYQSSDWEELIELWKYFNLALIHSALNIETQNLIKERKEHNLNEIAWQTIPKERTATLEYFIKDYFGHLKHHIDQLFENAKG